MPCEGETVDSGVVNGTFVAVVATRTARKPASKSASKASPKAAAKGNGTSRPKAGSKSDGKLRQAAAAIWASHRGDILAVGFIFAGLVAACGIWADVAGPFGAGLRIAAGALVGSVRALTPIALVAIGVVLLRGPRPGDTPAEGAEGASATRDGGHTSRAELVLAVRLGIGTALTLLSVTSLLHITLGRPGIGDFDGLAGAGGVLGLAVGGALAAGMGPWGAGLTMTAFGLLGTVVLTRVSLRTWARRVDGAKLKAALAWIARSISDKVSGTAAPPANADHGPPLPPHGGVDVEAEGPPPGSAEAETVVVPAPEAEPEQGPSAAASVPAEPEPPPAPIPEPEPEWQAPAIVDDRDPQPSVWKLPPLELLTGSDPQQANQQEAAQMGAALERALAAHDVATKLVGMVVGPYRDPLRAGAGRGGQGQPGHQPEQGHRLRHGLARRPHPGPDPRSSGHRGGGAQPRPPKWCRWAASWVHSRPARLPTPSRWPSGGTSTPSR